MSGREMETDPAVSQCRGGGVNVANDLLIIVGSGMLQQAVLQISSSAIFMHRL